MKKITFGDVISDGCIAVESTSGQGTTFLIRLPLHGDGKSRGRKDKERKEF
ncbi:MAG: hypothetical protein P8013_02885 [Candidatus Sulfobium sp.]